MVKISTFFIDYINGWMIKMSILNLNILWDTSSIVCYCSDQINWCLKKKINL